MDKDKKRNVFLVLLFLILRFAVKHNLVPKHYFSKAYKFYIIFINKIDDRVIIKKGEFSSFSPPRKKGELPNLILFNPGQDPENIIVNPLDENIFIFREDDFEVLFKKPEVDIERYVAKEHKLIHGVIIRFSMWIDKTILKQEIDNILNIYYRIKSNVFCKIGW